MLQKQNEYQPLINIQLKKDDKIKGNFQMNDTSIEIHNNFINIKIQAINREI